MNLRWRIELHFNRLYHHLKAPELINIPFLQNIIFPFIKEAWIFPDYEEELLIIYLIAKNQRVGKEFIKFKVEKSIEKVQIWKSRAQPKFLLSRLQEAIPSQFAYWDSKNSSSRQSSPEEEEEEEEEDFMVFPTSQIESYDISPTPITNNNIWPIWTRMLITGWTCNMIGIFLSIIPVSDEYLNHFREHFTELTKFESNWSRSSMKIEKNTLLRLPPCLAVNVNYDNLEHLKNNYPILFPSHLRFHSAGFTIETKQEGVGDSN